MKGICNIWSRGRHFSPSLPGDRYLKLSSQKRSPSRNLGEHRLVRRSGTASRGTALLVPCLRTRSLFPYNSISYGNRGKKYPWDSQFADENLLEFLMFWKSEDLRKCRTRTWLLCPSSVNFKISKHARNPPGSEKFCLSSYWFTLCLTLLRLRLCRLRR